MDIGLVSIRNRLLICLFNIYLYNCCSILPYIYQEKGTAKNKIAGTVKGRMWLSEQLPKFDQINALKFDIKLFCSDGGILETLNKDNGSYHTYVLIIQR